MVIKTLSHNYICNKCQYNKYIDVSITSVYSKYDRYLHKQVNNDKSTNKQVSQLKLLAFH